MTDWVVALLWLVACGSFYASGYCRGRSAQIRDEIAWHAKGRRK